MFRRFIPASCSACGAGVPRSAAGRCPSCRTAFVAVAQTATSPQGMPLRAPIRDGQTGAMLDNTSRRP